MKFFNFLGWIIVPFIMIFKKWRTMKKLNRLAGVLWALSYLLWGFIILVNSVSPGTPSYQIVKNGNVNFGNVIRLQYWVIPANNATDTDMKLISFKVLEKAKNDHPFNALAIDFVKSKSEADHGGYTIGQVEYVPYGDWGKANQVRAGDYSHDKFVYHFKK